MLFDQPDSHMDGRRKTLYISCPSSSSACKHQSVNVELYRNEERTREKKMNEWRLLGQERRKFLWRVFTFRGLWIVSRLEAFGLMMKMMVYPQLNKCVALFGVLPEVEVEALFGILFVDVVQIVHHSCLGAFHECFSVLLLFHYHGHEADETEPPLVKTGSLLKKMNWIDGWMDGWIEMRQ